MASSMRPKVYGETDELTHFCITLLSTIRPKLHVPVAIPVFRPNERCIFAKKRVQRVSPNSICSGAQKRGQLADVLVGRAKKFPEPIRALPNGLAAFQTSIPEREREREGHCTPNDAHRDRGKKVEYLEIQLSNSPRRLAGHSRA